MTFDQFISQTNINVILNEEYLMQYPETDAIDAESLEKCQKYAFEKLNRVHKWGGCFLRYLKLASTVSLGGETSPIVDLRETTPGLQQGDEGAENRREEARAGEKKGEEAKDSMGQEHEGAESISEEYSKKSIDANKTSMELHEQVSQLTSEVIETVKDIAEEVARLASCERQIGVEVSLFLLIEIGICILNCI